MSVEFGVLLPTREAIMSGRPETGSMLAMAERAEATGFDSVWIGDSITARPRHEPLTLLTAVAARTRRVRVGTAVLLPALRHPVVLAHVVGTLDRVAEGRVILGVGIAADAPAIRREFEAVGVPFPRRVGRFLETLAICRALWSQDGVSFSGTHFTLHDVTVEPKPHRPGGPPIWIGGSGPTALREAARFDAWFPTGPSVEFFSEHWPRNSGRRARGGSPARRRDRRGLRHPGPRSQRRRRRAEAGRLPRVVLRGAGARDPRPSGVLRGTDRGLRRMAPALDRRRHAPHPAALRRRRSTRPGRCGRVAPASAAPSRLG